jgi:protein-S-isoprenylcysteine O-methyltransferase Ste14
MNETSSLAETQVIETMPETLPAVPGVIVFPPVLFLSSIVLGTALQFVRPIHLGAALPARIGGGLLALMGVAAVAAAKRSLRRAGTNVRPDKPTTAIVNDGPYRFTRNPIYLGASLAYLGVAVVLNVFWPLPALAPFLVLLDWGVVRREEEYLERKFGDGYRAYKRRVRRWI